MAAAKTGGHIVRNYFGNVLHVEEKTCAADFRTKADTESEAAIVAILGKAFPAYNIFSEERGLIDKKSDYTFYIDPLDGTNNFFLGIPNFSVSIGLAKATEAVFGAIYLPMLDVLYYAEKGRGAFRGGVGIKASAEPSLKNSVAAFACNYLCPKSFIEKTVGALTRNAKRVLVNWSPAADLCLLASGKIETLVNKGTEIHDFLAGKLIAKEAGCLVTDFKGRPERDDFNASFVVSGNPDIHHSLLKLL